MTHNDDSDGHAGFSFIKVCNSGEAAGKGACPANPLVGSSANTWGCTKDNVTGLLWEIKTEDGGLHDKDTVYYNYTAAYNPDRLYGSEVDANGLVKTVNAAGLCGGNDWRLPTADELQGIVDYGIASSGPMIDTMFFPNTAQKAYWSSSPSVGFSRIDIDNAWLVSFTNGSISSSCRGCLNGAVRLVRSGN